MPKMTKKCGGKLVIVNLQNTPLDGICDVKINGSIDEVMAGVMKRLGLEVPTWKLRRRLVIGHEMNKESGDMKVFVQGIDVDDEAISASILKAVEFSYGDSAPKTIKSEPFLFTTDRVGPETSQTIKLTLHFMQHYGTQTFVSIKFKFNSPFFAPFRRTSCDY